MLKCLGQMTLNNIIVESFFCFFVVVVVAESGGGGHNGFPLSTLSDRTENERSRLEKEAAR